LVGNLKVLNLEEEADPAGDLLAYERRLVITVGSGEQNARLGARRPNNDSPFLVARICQR
jgi:hypothetical protein